MKYYTDQDPAEVRDKGANNEAWKRRVYRHPSGRLIAKPGVTKGNADTEDERQELTPEGIEPANETVLSTESGVRGDQTAEAIAAAAEAPERADNNLRWAYSEMDRLLTTHDAEPLDSSEDQAWLKHVEGQTKGALQQFQLRSKLLSSMLTPNSALLKFEGSAHLTVEQVLKRRSEFLTTHGLNVISVRPERGVVSLSIERVNRKIVRLQDVWRRWQPDSTHGNQELLIGVREDNGNLLFLSPGGHHAPHTLIAGSTGSGKSVLMQNIILGIAATNKPKQARIVLIDPKQGVDYFQFDGLPHLDGGVIHEQEVALHKLRALVGEMDSRYGKLKNVKTNNLTAYNQKVSDAEQLPVIWVIHDEFAEWMMVDDYKEEVTALVARLGVKARAAGIYLVFAAQRPDANVMPMQLRANLGNRLILRVDSEGTSEIALGEKGAERLLGRGHLLAKLEGAPLCYAQVPFVEVDFMENVVTMMSSKPS